MKNIKNTLLTLIIAFSLTLNLIAQELNKNEPPVITIFVHGSKPQIPKFFYQKGEYFFPQGLYHANNLCDRHGPREIIRGLKDSTYVDQEHLYFFGWSGKLNARERLIAAKALTEKIEKIVQAYIKKYDIMPKLHIITHSHGGNVALNVVHELESRKSNIVINEMILLAPPVQAWTKEYVKSKNVNKIYNFYSEGDLIQIADPQGLQVHFNKNNVIDMPELFEQSKRTFEHHKNVTQIQTIINEKDPWHITFIDYYPPALKDILRHFPHQFPRFLPELGNIMQKIKGAEVQAHIKQHQKPIKVKIDTHKATNNNRIAMCF